MANPIRSPSTAEPRRRYERKFEAARIAIAEIEMILRLHPAGFGCAFPARWVNNLYLDTNDLRAFHTHVNGAPRRDKLRIRWYGPARGTAAAPVLEVKSRWGQVGAKSRFPLPPFECGRGFDFDPIRRSVLERIADADLAEAVERAVPTLFNRYHRRYLISGDRRFRITIDSELCFEAVGRGIGGGVARFEERGITVLELKYDVAHDGAAACIARHLPFRLGKSSKYVRGITRLMGLRA
jgi:hypothetical protein